MKFRTRSKIAAKKHKRHKTRCVEKSKRGRLRLPNKMNRTSPSRVIVSFLRFLVILRGALQQVAQIFGLRFFATCLDLVT
ncbi:MAG: hypothetical protein DME21_02255 [Verrucomicrobia bacterium]|nr:MAG: hypothetical protein DME21_02255 [Verrucomicrobiota bacterium]